MPYLGARLEAAGYGGAAIGVLLSMLPVGRLVSAPIWAWAADRWRIAGALLRAGCLVALAGTLLLFARDPVLVALGLVLFAVGRAPFGPLVDVLVLEALETGGGTGADYGRVRLWGSFGFLLVAWICGILSDSFGVDPLWLGAGLAAACLGCAALFPTGGAGGPAPVMPALRALLGQPFLAPFLATAFLQALTLSVYDTFFSAHVHALGLPDGVTGAAVVVGVAVEVAVMRGAGGLLRRFGAPTVLLAATISGLPRWALTLWVTDPVALVAVQALHGVGFGAFWVAGVQIVAERAPTRIAASAQSLFAVASYGCGALVGALVAGAVRERWGTAAIFEALLLVAALAVVTALLFVRRERAGATAAAER